MTSSPEDPVGTAVAALRRHPRRAMTATELAARAGRLDADRLAATLVALRERGVIVTHEVLPPDPHFPPITAVALVEDADRPEAHRRAEECARVLQRQLMRSHRCR